MIVAMPLDPEEKKKRQREAQARWLAKPENREKHRAAVRRYREAHPEVATKAEARRKADPVRYGKRKEAARAAQERLRKEQPKKKLDSHLRHNYGITLEEFEILEKAQEGVCAICKKTETWVRAGKVYRLSVDHCHDTGKIRGLLCKACNTGIGYFLHDPELLRAAIKYLKHPPAAPFVGK